VLTELWQRAGQDFLSLQRASVRFSSFLPTFHQLVVAGNNPQAVVSLSESFGILNHTSLYMYHAQFYSFALNVTSELI